MWYERGERPESHLNCTKVLLYAKNRFEDVWKGDAFALLKDERLLRALRPVNLVSQELQNIGYIPAGSVGERQIAGVIRPT